MLSRKARWFGAVAAAVIVGVGVYFWLALDYASVALGQVLANTEQAETLHVRITSGDKQMEFWHTSKPNRSRGRSRRQLPHHRRKEILDRQRESE